MYSCFDLGHVMTMDHLSCDVQGGVVSNHLRMRYRFVFELRAADPDDLDAVGPWPDPNQTRTRANQSHQANHHVFHIPVTTITANFCRTP